MVALLVPLPCVLLSPCPLTQPHTPTSYAHTNRLL